jgi:hypothetical protein
MFLANSMVRGRFGLHEIPRGFKILGGVAAKQIVEDAREAMARDEVQEEGQRHLNETDC